FESLHGAPVILSGLHSALPAIVIGVRSVNPDARIVYVMTDGAALPIAFSDTVSHMKDEGVLHATITAGQAFGGDYEAVNVYSAIAAAREVANADVIITGMGPGNLGTGSKLGFAMLEQASLANAVAALGGTPILVPRISFSDARPRHRALSHHTVTVLSLTLAEVTVTLPPFPAERAQEIDRSVSGLRSRHKFVEVELGEAEEILAKSDALRSMGRTFADDPSPFRTAAAAGVYAATM
ncbi:MAG: DUF3866 family protein, partial [Actinobacteria bacterium]|nr:DUF3866 family protein [Actinomycetota bacterium]